MSFTGKIRRCTNLKNISVIDKNWQKCKVNKKPQNKCQISPNHALMVTILADSGFK